MKLQDLLAITNPFYPGYEPLKISGIKNIVNYMVAEQVSLYGSSILTTIPYKITLRNMGLLFSEYTEKQIILAIDQALAVCDHPFSTKKIKEFL